MLGATLRGFSAINTSRRREFMFVRPPCMVVSAVAAIVLVVCEFVFLTSERGES